MCEFFATNFISANLSCENETCKKFIGHANTGPGLSLQYNYISVFFNWLFSTLPPTETKQQGVSLAALPLPLPRLLKTKRVVRYDAIFWKTTQPEPTWRIDPFLMKVTHSLNISNKVQQCTSCRASEYWYLWIFCLMLWILSWNPLWCNLPKI